jgi:hypothetical protein
VGSPAPAASGRGCRACGRQMPSGMGGPLRSVIRWIFDPFLPWSVGFGPVRGLFCGSEAGGVDGAPRPVGLTTGAGLVQDDPVEPGPDPVLAPPGETPVVRRPGRAEHRGQLPPGAPGVATEMIAARHSRSPARCRLPPCGRMTPVG